MLRASGREGRHEDAALSGGGARVTGDRTTTQDLVLGTFINRSTFRYVRDYPHPRERVWEAITKPQHWDAWFMPRSRVDARVGGRFHFTFGREFADPWSWSGAIAEFAAPEVVDYTFDKGGGMRFELEAIAGGTRLYLTHTMPRGFVWADGEEGQPGGDEPGGADAPWRPGGMAGFLIALINLDSYLASTPRQSRAELRALYDDKRSEIPGADWSTLTQTYRRHIAHTIPGGVVEKGDSSQS